MQLDELIAFLADFFNTSSYPPEEQGGIFYRPNSFPISQPVRRIGLVLEPWPGLADWLRENRIDTLWLHRPWNLDLIKFPKEVAVISHHLPFDEHLTIGYNRPMAEVAGMQWINAETPQAIGYKQAPGFPIRSIGMLGLGVQLSFSDWCDRITTRFGGYDDAWPGNQPTLARIAVVGAMTNELVREAADQGAELYLTGQFRRTAQKAVDETGIAVIAIGHRRTEQWGLKILADVLQTQIPSVFCQNP